MNMIVNFPLLVFALSFVLLVFSAKVGDALRKKVSRVREDVGADFGVVLTGALTLLALIIGFSFSMAINRYDLRKNYEQAEAVAIAIEYIRADLLPRGDASRAQEFLRNYLDQRVLFYTTRDQRQLQKIAATTSQIQSELWSTIRSAIAAVPPPLEGVVVTGMTDVVNSQLSTQAAWLNRIPVAAWVLNLVISIGCNFLIGFRARRTDWLVFLILPIVVSVSLLLICDLDSPRGGAIHVAPHDLMNLSQYLRVYS
jgi:hypothetical protein